MFLLLRRGLRRCVGKQFYFVKEFVEVMSIDFYAILLNKQNMSLLIIAYLNEK